MFTPLCLRVGLPRSIFISPLFTECGVIECLFCSTDRLLYSYHGAQIILSALDVMLCLLFIGTERVTTLQNILCPPPPLQNVLRGLWLGHVFPTAPCDSFHCRCTITPLLDRSWLTTVVCVFGTSLALGICDVHPALNCSIASSAIELPLTLCVPEQIV